MGRPVESPQSTTDDFFARGSGELQARDNENLGTAGGKSPISPGRTKMSPYSFVSCSLAARFRLNRTLSAVRTSLSRLEEKWLRRQCCPTSSTSTTVFRELHAKSRHCRHDIPLGWALPPHVRHDMEKLPATSWKRGRWFSCYAHHQTQQPNPTTVITTTAKNQTVVQLSMALFAAGSRIWR